MPVTSTKTSRLQLRLLNGRRFRRNRQEPVLKPLLGRRRPHNGTIHPRLPRLPRLPSLSTSPLQLHHSQDSLYRISLVLFL